MDRRLAQVELRRVESSRVSGTVERGTGKWDAQTAKLMNRFAGEQSEWSQS